MAHHLAQLKIKLLNTVNTRYRPNVPAEAHLAAGEVLAVVDEIFGALGSCDRCYGRGYLIANDTGKYCTCERAERLKEFVKHYGAISNLT